MRHTGIFSVFFLPVLMGGAYGAELCYIDANTGSGVYCDPNCCCNPVYCCDKDSLVIESAVFGSLGVLMIVVMIVCCVRTKLRRTQKKILPVTTKKPPPPPVVPSLTTVDTKVVPEHLSESKGGISPRETTGTDTKAAAQVQHPHVADLS